MDIVYTKHATGKLKTKEIKKLKIDGKKIESVVKAPTLTHRLQFGVVRATGELDSKHSLCVVFKVENFSIKIITFFPAEKGRYENQIL